jgi:hypothetical protein
MTVAAGDGFHCGIRVERALAGGVLCWYINHVVYGRLDGEWEAHRHG